MWKQSNPHWQLKPLSVGPSIHSSFLPSIRPSILPSLNNSISISLWLVEYEPHCESVNFFADLAYYQRVHPSSYLPSRLLVYQRLCVHVFHFCFFHSLSLSVRLASYLSSYWVASLRSLLSSKVFVFVFVYQATVLKDNVHYIHFLNCLWSTELFGLTIYEILQTVNVETPRIQDCMWQTPTAVNLFVFCQGCSNSRYQSQVIFRLHQTLASKPLHQTLKHFLKHDNWTLCFTEVSWELLEVWFPQTRSTPLLLLWAVKREHGGSTISRLLGFETGIRHEQVHVRHALQLSGLLGVVSRH